MEKEQIIKELSNEGFSILENSCLILKEDRKRIRAFGEIATTELSKYLGKVVLYQMTNNNRREMLELEHFLVDNKIPYNHCK